MIYAYGNSENDVAICRIGNVPEHGVSLQDFIDIWHPVLDLKFRYPHRHLSQ